MSNTINKVVYAGNTLIDLTDLDVTAGDVVSGVTFIMADGTKAVGTITIPTKTSDLENDSGFISKDSNNDVSGLRNISYNGAVKGTATTIDLATTPQSNISTSKLLALDKNGKSIGAIYARQTTSNEAGLQIGAVRTVNGSDTYNLINLLIDSSGTKSCTFSDPSAFRAGLGLDSMFHITSTSPTGYSFTANQYRSLTSSSLTTYSGYTPIITRAVCTSHSAIRVFNWWYDSGTLHWEAISQSSSSLSSVNFAFTILWVSNSYIA